MGTTPSKDEKKMGELKEIRKECEKRIKKYSQSSMGCTCAPFALQPHCLSNRHLHVFQKKTDLIMLDLTFGKQFIFPRLFQNVNRQNLRDKQQFDDTDLEVMNVVAFQWNLAVVQVFIRNGVTLFALDCLEQKCLAIYTMYTKDTGLYECYLTNDKQYMLIKPNLLYWVSHLKSVGQMKTMDLVKLNHHHRTGNCIQQFNQINSAVAFSPDDSSLYIASLPDETSTAPSITAYSVICNGTAGILNQNIMLDSLHQDFEGKFINLQVSRSSGYLLLSMLGQSLDHTHSGPPRICKDYRVTTYIISKKSLVTSKKYEYISLTGLRNFAPVISPSGKYIFLDNKMMYVSIETVTSLKQICCELLTELVLPEDANQLPIPKTLQQLVAFGYSPKTQFQHRTQK
ncbi:hypothetical protein CHS0354_007525 [Potamilus streckersoni]|uniref:Uncharacterized protein n=1 Tax=Potamilus streckersoni TaxID=2493646 RepID=A0AAE0T7V7_9BIVA|nr:hypothetical protein CHS0354_007525 [Potamilus streckersoni]